MLATEQLSVAVAIPTLTSAEHSPAVFGTVMFAGQAITGACTSLTVTVKLQLDWLLPASVAVQVTIVTPDGNVEPEAGLHENVGLG
jgi:hypothetical protein